MANPPFVDIWAQVLGDYAATIPIETFLDSKQNRNGGQATPHLARLLGVRFLRTSEPERGAVLAEATIKLMTSSEPMLVRHLNREFFELKPQFTLVVSGNYKPRIRGTDDGIWRRVVLVPWPVKLTDASCDPRLADKLRGELPGILNRILDGACAWLDKGLVIPDSIRDATADYRAASDPFGRFLAECVRRSPGERVASRALYEVFVAWAKATGNSVWSQSGVGRAMLDRGYDNVKSGNHFWLDIELTKRPEDFADSTPERPPSGSPPASNGSATADEEIEF